MIESCVRKCHEKLHGLQIIFEKRIFMNGFYLLRYRNLTSHLTRDQPGHNSGMHTRQTLRRRGREIRETLGLQFTSKLLAPLAIDFFVISSHFHFFISSWKQTVTLKRSRRGFVALCAMLMYQTVS